MRSWVKLITLVVAVVIVGSLLGLGQAVGSIAVLVLVVGVLFVVLRGVTGGSSGGGSIVEFARLRTPPASSFFSILLAGQAAAKITAAPGWALGASLGLVVLLGFGMGFVPSAAGIVLGVGGGVSVMVLAVTRTECRMGATSLAVAVAVVVAALVGVVLVVSGAIGASIPRSSRPRLGDWALMGFGLVSLTLFVVAPAGLEVWVEPSPLLLAVALALILIIGIYSAIQPKLVKALVSVAMLTATFMLATYEQISFGGNVAPCANPIRDMVLTVVFTLVAAPIAGYVERRESTFR
jgi:hypothetical protein